jgi:hypothetical protein
MVPFVIVVGAPSAEDPPPTFLMVLKDIVPALALVFPV